MSVIVRQKNLVPTLVQPTLEYSEQGGQNFSGHPHQYSASNTRMFATLNVYYDTEDADRLHANLRHQGHQLHTIDAWIAIIALRYDLILLTTDADFEGIDGLATGNWFD